VEAIVAGAWRTSEAVAEECSRLLGDHRLGRVLDAGGGSGVLTGYLLRHREADDACVLDTDPGPLAEVVPPMTAKHGRIEDLTAADGPFDTILLRQVLQYVDEPVATLRRVADRLADGGIVYVGQLVTPDPESARWLAQRARWVSPTRRRVWTVDHLLVTLGQAGLHLNRATLVPHWQPLTVHTGASAVRGTMPVRATLGVVQGRVSWLHATLTPER
jgi:SAM-dependent methyltransferase